MTLYPRSLLRKCRNNRPTQAKHVKQRGDEIVPGDKNGSGLWQKTLGQHVERSTKQRLETTKKFEVCSITRRRLPQLFDGLLL